MRGLQGKVFVVGGGGTSPDGPGNGAATAIRLAEEGAQVVVGDLVADAAAATVEIIANAGGVAVASVFDMTDDASCDELVAFAASTYGGVDGLHVNAYDMAMAGGEDGTTDALGVSIDAWNRTIDVNLTGSLRMVKSVLPELLTRGGGSIVLTSSDAAFIGEPVRAAYGTTKAGVHALMRHVASRWGRKGIRCNVVAPGLIARRPEDDARISGNWGRPERHVRHGRPNDIAAAAAFLLSADGEWVNGQVWSVNGGHVLH